MIFFLPRLLSSCSCASPNTKHHPCRLWKLWQIVILPLLTFPLTASLYFHSLQLPTYQRKEEVFCPFAPQFLDYLIPFSAGGVCLCCICFHARRKSLLRALSLSLLCCRLESVLCFMNSRFPSSMKGSPSSPLSWAASGITTSPWQHRVELLWSVFPSPSSWK